MSQITESPYKFSWTGEMDRRRKHIADELIFGEPILFENKRCEIIINQKLILTATISKIAILKRMQKIAHLNILARHHIDAFK